MSKAGKRPTREWRIDGILSEVLDAWNNWHCVVAGDLFAPKHDDAEIDAALAVMALASGQRFQVATAHAARMREYLTGRDAAPRIIDRALRMRELPHDWRWPIPNVWLIVTVHTQAEANSRVPDLLATPAAVRGVRVEPREPVDLTDITRRLDRYTTEHFDALDRIEARMYADEPGALPALDWVICAGGSDPVQPGWVSLLRDQCAVAGVPFCFEGWGEYLPIGQRLPGYGRVHGVTSVKPGRMKLHCGGAPGQAPKHAFAKCGVEFALTADNRLTLRVGKKAAGRLLDGREHNDMPEVGDA